MFVVSVEFVVPVTRWPVLLGTTPLLAAVRVGDCCPRGGVSTCMFPPTAATFGCRRWAKSPTVGLALVSNDVAAGLRGDSASRPRSEKQLRGWRVKGYKVVIVTIVVGARKKPRSVVVRLNTFRCRPSSRCNVRRTFAHYCLRPCYHFSTKQSKPKQTPFARVSETAGTLEPVPTSIGATSCGYIVFRQGRRRHDVLGLVFLEVIVAAPIRPS